MGRKKILGLVTWAFRKTEKYGLRNWAQGCPFSLGVGES